MHNKVKRIGIISDNTLSYVETIIDIWNEGSSAVLLNNHTPIHTIAEVLEITGAKECYVEDRLLDSLSSISNNLILKSLPNPGTSAQKLKKRIRKKYKESFSENEAVVLFSSGTTGIPKGVRLSHKSITQNAHDIISFYKITSSDSILISRSLFYSSPLVTELLVALITNADVIIQPSITPPRVTLKNIYSYNITIFGTNPSILKILIASPSPISATFKSLRMICVSGEKIEIDTYNNAKAFFGSIPINLVYGMTELGPRVTAQNEQFHTLGSSGVPIGKTEIDIRDNSGMSLQHDKIGLIWVKSESAFSGYLMQDNSTNSLFVDGWFCTGDIGKVSANELFVVGRNDNVIILNAHKVIPESLETIIIQDLKVYDCIVTLSPTGLYLVCFYTGKKLSRKESLQILSERLISYEIPKQFVRVQSIKRKNGKKDRNYYRTLKNVEAVEE